MPVTVTIRTTWTCTKCDPPEAFKTFEAAQRHANAVHHGGRISIAVPARRPA